MANAERHIAPDPDKARWSRHWAQSWGLREGARYTLKMHGRTMLVRYDGIDPAGYVRLTRGGVCYCVDRDTTPFTLKVWNGPSK